MAKDVFFPSRYPDPPEKAPEDSMSEEDWKSLSPGMRREIWRQYQKDQLK